MTINQAQFYGNIDYDVFRFMRDNGMKYGHGSSMDKILGYNARSAPSLLWRTRSFMDVHPELIHPEADLDWLLLDREPQSRDNNKRQFSSNVEIGDLHFFRGEQHGRYFEWLDRSGGFFYEFPGDAAVRALSAAMFLPKRQVWFLGDVGCQYRVDGYVHYFLSFSSYQSIYCSKLTLSTEPVRAAWPTGANTNRLTSMSTLAGSSRPGSGRRSRQIPVRETTGRRRGQRELSGGDRCASG